MAENKNNLLGERTLYIQYIRYSVYQQLQQQTWLGNLFEASKNESHVFFDGIAQKFWLFFISFKQHDHFRFFVKVIWDN